MLKLLLALLLALPAQAPETFEPARYQEGQVWEYRTRPGDEGSLLKIQRVEDWPAGGQVYHISVIGVRIAGQENNQIQHLPVSELTLNASVTRLSPSNAEFPSPDEGIGLWREAKGGVFDISLAEIIETAARQIESQMDGQQPAAAPVPVA